MVEATTDPLTGLHNRSHLDGVADHLVALAERSERPISCLMIDLDHFKSVNDTYGHDAGDAVLEGDGRRFSRAVRRSDVLVRYGGEEFVVLLPDTDSAGAMTMAARLRMRLEAAPIVFTQPEHAAVEIVVRASVGVASWQPGVEDAAGLISVADGRCTGRRRSGAARRARRRLSSGARPIESRAARRGSSPLRTA